MATAKRALPVRFFIVRATKVAVHELIGSIYPHDTLVKVTGSVVSSNTATTTTATTATITTNVASSATTADGNGCRKSISIRRGILSVVGSGSGTWPQRRQNECFNSDLVDE